MTKTNTPIENLAQYELNSAIGPIYFVASEKGLKGIWWRRPQGEFISSLKDPSPAVQIIARAVQQIEEYLRGERRTFDLPYDVDGTDFQRKVWQQLAKIPFGETVSYREIAIRLKNEKAVRAVGTANGRNPLSIVVPCHRVIGANGTLTGYAGGLPIKEKLLTIEGLTGWK